MRGIFDSPTLARGDSFDSPTPSLAESFAFDSPSLAEGARGWVNTPSLQENPQDFCNNKKGHSVRNDAKFTPNFILFTP